jgi:hypothetical protein
MFAHQETSFRSDEKATMAKKYSWLLRRQRLPTSEQGRRLECGRLSMTLSMSSWGNDSMTLGLEVSVQEEPPRSFLDSTTAVMPFKKSNRHPVEGGTAYNYHYLLLKSPANVGKYQFRVRALVCDSPNRSSCLRKNPSVADRCSGHGFISTPHLPLALTYDGEAMSRGYRLDLAGHIRVPRRGRNRKLGE